MTARAEPEQNGWRIDKTINLSALLTILLFVVLPLMVFLYTEGQRDAAVQAKLDRVAELIIETNDNTKRLNNIDQRLAVIDERTEKSAERGRKILQEVERR